MIAYHNDPAIKGKYLARVRAHREANQLVHGRGWENGKGCAVGCIFNAYDHSRGPKEIGVPVQLIYLCDAIFEGLSKAEAQEWPEQFLTGIQVGADLSGIWPKFAIALLTDLTGPVWPQVQGQEFFKERGAILQVAECYRRSAAKEEFAAAAKIAAAWAAKATWDINAARAARAASAASAARAAAWAASAAWDTNAASAVSAINAASAAAWAASAVVWATWAASAARAARAAAWAATSDTRTASVARAVKESVYQWERDLLLKLLAP